MNKNVVGIILIVVAIGLVAFYLYPSVKANLGLGTPAVTVSPDGVTSAPI
jgi:hypothetical protein